MPHAHCALRLHCSLRGVCVCVWRVCVCPSIFLILTLLSLSPPRLHTHEHTPTSQTHFLGCWGTAFLPAHREGVSARQRRWAGRLPCLSHTLTRTIPVHE